MSERFTLKQQRFVGAYNGNATEAARKAGYRQPRQMGAENLSKPYIRDAVQARESKTCDALIATREQRQEFWTNIMDDDEMEMRDRLRASELLGKSQADFLDRHEHAVVDGVRFSIDLRRPSERAEQEEQDA